MAAEWPLRILVVRDPDGADAVSVYVNGVRVPWADYEIESVDAGAGYEYEESWLPRIEAAEAMPPSDFRDDLLEALNDPPGREYIDNFPDAD